jgi:hypothetical protein
MMQAIVSGSVGLFQQAVEGRGSLQEKALVE